MEVATAPLVAATRATERRCSTGGGHPRQRSHGVGGLSSTTPHGGPTTASAMEEEVREVNDALEGQKRPPPGMQSAPLH